MTTLTIDEALDRAGAGTYQKRLIGIFGLVWTADAMQVLAVGFTAASIAATFGLTVPQALQTGTLFFLGMLVGAIGFGRLADRIGRIAPGSDASLVGLSDALEVERVWIKGRQAVGRPA